MNRGQEKRKVKVAFCPEAEPGSALIDLDSPSPRQESPFRALNSLYENNQKVLNIAHLKNTNGSNRSNPSLTNMSPKHKTEIYSPSKIKSPARKRIADSPKKHRNVQSAANGGNFKYI